jgi:flagellar biosynthetic protein FliP
MDYLKDIKYKIKLTGTVLENFPGSSLIIIIFFLFIVSHSCAGQTLPKITLGFDKAETPEDVSTSLQVIFLLTILTLAPAILILTTSFTRILVVFSFLRHALSTQQMPSNQILIGLSLFLTFFIMSPVINEIHDTALKPYLDKEMTQSQAFKLAQVPLREFMLRQVREKDLALFAGLYNHTKPNNVSELSTLVIIPAFVISELRIAFQIGFLIYIPFLIIDMIVASVLMAMGMLMLPPVMISMPFKILLFVLTDGWYLIVNSMIMSFK